MNQPFSLLVTPSALFSWSQDKTIKVWNLHTVELTEQDLRNWHNVKAEVVQMHP